MTAGDATQTSATDTAAKELRCTFCGKSQFDVRKLIAGPTAFICDECVTLCVKVCQDDKAPPEMGIPAPHAAHLTNVLRRCGALGDGRVRDVVVESSHNTILSRIIRLRLAYDGPAEGAPCSVILKTGLPGRAGDGRQEVAFYNQVASAMSARVAPRCFEAHWAPETKAWHLLLEDLTDSHAAPTQWPLPPTVTKACASLGRWPASMPHGGTIQALVSRWELGWTPMPWVRGCKVLPACSSASLIASAISCRVNGALSTSGSSTQRLACLRDITHIATSRSSMTTHTS